MFDQDQAAGLRALFVRKRPDVIVAFGAASSQAALLAALARSMASEGSGVLLIDGSAGLAAAQFSVQCRYELGHVLAGDKDLEQVVRIIEPGLTLLPALRGLDLLAELPPDAAKRARQQFARMFDKKGASIDAILINSKALSATRALDAFSARAHLLLVLDQGVVALKTAYQEIKALAVAHDIASIDVVVAGTARGPLAFDAFERLKATAFEFLGVTLNLQSAQRESAGSTTPGATDAAIGAERGATAVNRLSLSECSRGLTC
jgi:MinD-like ATPase involved in chromosome partitioning or flagellar assembly